MSTVTLEDRAREIAAQRLASLMVLRELDRPLRTDEASVWLTEELGVPVSAGQLANLRVIGGGPAFQYAGRYVQYTKAALAAFACRAGKKSPAIGRALATRRGGRRDQNL